MLPSEIVIQDRRVTVHHNENGVEVGLSKVAFTSLFSDASIQQAWSDIDEYREMLQETFSVAASHENKRIAYHRSADEINDQYA